MIEKIDLSVYKKHSDNYGLSKFWRDELLVKMADLLNRIMEVLDELRNSKKG